MVLIPARRAQRPRINYKTTTLRQFDGGWNVIDNELNLTPRFARIFDNVTRGPDGSVAVRYGYELWRDLKTGVEQALGSMDLSVAYSTGNKKATITWAGHPFVTGDHIKLAVTNIVGGSGITTSHFDTHSVRVIDVNSFQITMLNPPTTTVTAETITATVTRDTHFIGNRIVNGTFFSNRFILVSAAGEIVSIDLNGTATRIWDEITAFNQSGAPSGWGPIDFASFNSFGGRLQVHSGYDKPVEVDFNRTPIVQYLGDPAAGGNNAAVPIGRYSTNSAGYSVIAGKSDKPNELSISAHLAAGVWVGNTDPDDAVNIDMGKVSSVNDARIIGLSELRNRLIVAFRDALSIGTLGHVEMVTIGTETVPQHEPDFKDTVAQYGTVSHRTMVSLGNDVLMCDRVGVPSLAQSEQSGQFVPNRVSDLVEPALQQNLSRLTDSLLETKAFAIFNSRDKQYMLFMPKFDPTDIRDLPDDPVTFLTDLGPNRFIITSLAHGLEPGDIVLVSGLTNVGLNAAGYLNSTWTVEEVIDNNNIVIYNPDYEYPELNITGGGTAGTIQPKTPGMVGYILVYNPKQRVRSWSRYKDLDFDWGVKSVNGRLFFGKGGKIYQFGTHEFPFSSDAQKDYDVREWTAGTSYPIGYRIQDTVNGEFVVFESTEEHISSSVGVATFADERAAYPDRWKVYKGKPIKFVWEWPWGDFDKRLNTKAVRAVMPDTTGTGRFDLQIFVDLLYKNKNTGKLTPVRKLSFLGADAGGYGAGSQTYGGGRRTREQLYWPMPVNGKLHKFRIEGETTDPLRFIAVSIVYHEGTMKR